MLPPLSLSRPCWRGGLVCLALGMGVVLSGCGDSSRKKVYPVRGQVLVNGQPIPQATVTFHPVGTDAKELRPSAQTDEEGKFRLTSYVAGDGAPEGQYAVTVTWLRAFPVPGSPDGEHKAYNVLPLQYANPASSSLTASVNKGKNELPPLQLVVK